MLLIQESDSRLERGATLKIGSNITLDKDADGIMRIAATGGGVTDHGALDGLADDDHEQYLLVSGARELSADWDAGAFRITALNLTVDANGEAAVFGDGTNSSVWIALAGTRARIGYDAGNNLFVRGGTGKGVQLQTDGANTRLGISSTGVITIGKARIIDDSPFVTGFNIAASSTNAMAIGTEGAAVLSFFTSGSNRGRVLSGGDLRWDSAIRVDTITERTSEAGVTIDGLLIKDSGIPESAVTAHEAALSITEGQISDLQAYLLNISNEDLEDLSDVTITSIATGEILEWSGALWINRTLAEAGISATGHTHDHGALTGRDDDDHSLYHTDGRALTWLGTRSTTDLPEGTNLYFTSTRADARIAAASIADLATKDHDLLDGLGDDDHTQYLLANATRALTADWDVGAFKVRAETFQSDVATSTPPFLVASITKVVNLNADLLDGEEASAFADASHSHVKADISDTPWAKGDLPSAIAYEDEANIFTVGQTLESVDEASGIETTIDSPALKLVSKYWDGGASQDQTWSVWVTQPSAADDVSVLQIQDPDSNKTWKFSDDGATELPGTLKWGGGAAIASSDLDHGALGGLGDDDHAIYFLVDGGKDITGDLKPATDSTLDLGATGEVFAEVWADAIKADGPITITPLSDLIVAGAQARVASVPDFGTSSGNVTIDWDDGNVQEVTMGGNHQIGFSNVNDGAMYILIVKMGATEYLPTWTGVDWGDGGAPDAGDYEINKDVVLTFLGTGSEVLGFKSGTGFTYN